MSPCSATSKPATCMSTFASLHKEPAMCKVRHDERSLLCSRARSDASAAHERYTSRSATRTHSRYTARNTHTRTCGTASTHVAHRVYSYKISRWTPDWSGVAVIFLSAPTAKYQQQQQLCIERKRGSARARAKSARHLFSAVHRESNDLKDKEARTNTQNLQMVIYMIIIMYKINFSQTLNPCSKSSFEDMLKIFERVCQILFIITKKIFCKKTHRHIYKHYINECIFQIFITQCKHIANLLRVHVLDDERLYTTALIVNRFQTLRGISSHLWHAFRWHKSHILAPLRSHQTRIRSCANLTPRYQNVRLMHRKRGHKSSRLQQFWQNTNSHNDHEYNVYTLEKQVYARSEVAGADYTRGGSILAIIVQIPVKVGHARRKAPASEPPSLIIHSLAHTSQRVLTAFCLTSKNAVTARAFDFRQTTSRTRKPLSIGNFLFMSFIYGFGVQEQQRLNAKNVLQRDIEAHGRIVSSVVKLGERVAAAEAKAIQEKRNRCDEERQQQQQQQRDRQQQPLRVASSLERRWHLLFLRALEWQCHIEALAQRVRSKVTPYFLPASIFHVHILRSHYEQGNQTVIVYFLYSVFARTRIKKCSKYTVNVAAKYSSSRSSSDSDDEEPVPKQPRLSRRVSGHVGPSSGSSSETNSRNELVRRRSRRQLKARSSPRSVLETAASTEAASSDNRTGSLKTAPPSTSSTWIRTRRPTVMRFPKMIISKSYNQVPMIRRRKNGLTHLVEKLVREEGKEMSSRVPSLIFNENKCGLLSQQNHKQKYERIKEWLALNSVRCREDTCTSQYCQLTVPESLDSCDASGEYTTGESDIDRQSVTSEEDVQSSVSTSRRVHCGVSQSNSEELLDNATDELAAAASPCKPVETSTPKVVMRQKTGNRANEPRPWSVSCIQQIKMATSFETQDLSQHSISETALHKLLPGGMTSKNASLTASGSRAPLNNSTSTLLEETILGPDAHHTKNNTLRRRKNRHRKKNANRKSESGSDVLTTHNTRSENSDDVSSGNNNPSIIRSLRKSMGVRQNRSSRALVSKSDSFSGYNVENEPQAETTQTNSNPSMKFGFLHTAASVSSESDIDEGDKAATACVRIARNERIHATCDDTVLTIKKKRATQYGVEADSDLEKNSLGANSLGEQAWDNYQLALASQLSRQRQSDRGLVGEGELANLRDSKAAMLALNVSTHRLITDLGQKTSPTLTALKDGVADLYRLWDEAFQKGNQQLCKLQVVHQFEARLAELQCALRRDKDTLAVLDAALQAGATMEVATSVRDVARLLSEKHEARDENGVTLDSPLTPTLENIESVNVKQISFSDASHTTCSPFEGGSLSDSGISDSGSEQELSERERRLAALRRLTRSLESQLQPESCDDVLGELWRRVEEAEAELRNLQKQCRELIVRTAASVESKKSSKVADTERLLVPSFFKLFSRGLLKLSKIAMLPLQRPTFAAAVNSLVVLHYARDAAAASSRSPTPISLLRSYSVNNRRRTDFRAYPYGTHAAICKVERFCTCTYTSKYKARKVYHDVVRGKIPTLLGSLSSMIKAILVLSAFEADEIRRNPATGSILNGQETDTFRSVTLSPNQNAYKQSTLMSDAFSKRGLQHGMAIARVSIQFHYEWSFFRRLRFAIAFYNCHKYMLYTCRYMFYTYNCGVGWDEKGKSCSAEGSQEDRECSGGWCSSHVGSARCRSESPSACVHRRSAETRQAPPPRYSRLCSTVRVIHGRAKGLARAPLMHRCPITRTIIISRLARGERSRIKKGHSDETAFRSRLRYCVHGSRVSCKVNEKTCASLGAVRARYIWTSRANTRVQ
ncbi:unnamed protein product, partial [Trichogramma brassicae]